MHFFHIYNILGLMSPVHSFEFPNYIGGTARTFHCRRRGSLQAEPPMGSRGSTYCGVKGVDPVEAGSGCTAFSGVQGCSSWRGLKIPLYSPISREVDMMIFE